MPNPRRWLIAGLAVATGLGVAGVVFATTQTSAPASNVAASNAAASGSAPSAPSGVAPSGTAGSGAAASSSASPIATGLAVKPTSSRSSTAAGAGATKTHKPSATRSPSTSASPAPPAPNRGGALGTGRIQYGPTYTGEGTFYGATGAGNCSYEASSDRMIGAMNHLDYENSQACGAYVQVTGPTGTKLTIKIVDQCPECKPGDIDLSQEAFAALAPVSAGRIKISWHLLSPTLAGHVSYKYKDGSTQWWCAIQVRDHRNPLKSLEVRVNGAWKSLPRHDYNYFVAADGSGCGKDIRVTDIYGNRLVDTGISISPGTVQRGKSQFGSPR